MIGNGRLVGRIPAGNGIDIIGAYCCFLRYQCRAKMGCDEIRGSGGDFLLDGLYRMVSSRTSDVGISHLLVLNSYLPALLTGCRMTHYCLSFLLS